MEAPEQVGAVFTNTMGSGLKLAFPKLENTT